MTEFDEGDRVELVNVHRRRTLENLLNREGTVETVGVGECNEGHYEVQFEAFDGWENPQYLEWVEGGRLVEK